MGKIRKAYKILVQLPKGKRTDARIVWLSFFQEIFNELLPLGIHILTRGKESDGHLDSDSSAIIHNIVQRLTCDTAACLKYLDCWKFVQTSIMDWKVVLQDRGGNTCPAIIMMQQVSLKGPVLLGLLHVGMSWDSSFSIVIRLQAGWLENHGWIHRGDHGFHLCHHVVASGGGSTVGFQTDYINGTHIHMATNTAVLSPENRDCIEINDRIMNTLIQDE